MLKRIIIFTLILCLLAPLFVACGTNQDNDFSTDTEKINSDKEEKTDTECDTNEKNADSDSENANSDSESESDNIGDSDTESDSSTESDTADSDNESTDTNSDETVKPEPEAPKKQNWQDDGVLKILAIGNSFSDDAMEYVYQVAKDAGVEKISLGNMYIGGCTLATHLNNAKNNKNAYQYRTNTNGTWSTKNNVSIKTALESDNWDFVTFQQASGYSGVASTYDDLSALIKIVEETIPSARFAWHMTWAYQGNSTHNDFSKYGKNQATMYNAIVDAVNAKILTNDKIEIVIPSGTSIQNVRTSFLGDTLTRDGYHLSLGIGRYIASMTYVKALTGLSIDNSITRPNDVDAYELKMAIESVNNALKSPFEITVSSYPEKDDSSVNESVIPEGYVQLSATQMGLTPASFYYSQGNDVWNDTGSTWSSGFMATKKFTRDELPVGTIIEIAEGWQYRPEGWKYTGSRPGNVTITRIVIDESWWGTYTERGFNISQIAHTSSNNVVITLSPDEIANTIFKIIVPESAVK